MKKITRKDVIATRLINAAWELAAIVDNVRRSKVYYCYTKREAVSLFLKEVNGN